MYVEYFFRTWKATKFDEVWEKNHCNSNEICNIPDLHISKNRYTTLSSFVLCTYVWKCVFTSVSEFSTKIIGCILISKSKNIIFNVLRIECFRKHENKIGVECFWKNSISVLFAMRIYKRKKWLTQTDKKRWPLTDRRVFSRGCKFKPRLEKLILFVKIIFSNHSN